jgi:hypothetical protein
VLRQICFLFEYMHLKDLCNVPDHWPWPGCFDIDPRK